MSDLVAKFDTLYGSKSSEERMELIIPIIKIAETTERYEDMCQLVRKLVEMKVEEKQDLSVDERNLLSVAYKNAIGTRRASWRSLISSEAESEEAFKAFKNQIEKELKECSLDILNLLEKIIPSASDHEAEVFYYKMTGDYKRYLAECFSDEEAFAKDADEMYKKAMEIAEEHIPATNPIRLGLALNYSVCCYEISKKRDHACLLAKSAFDDAISKLDKLDEGDYKDSTLIMQLLRDNLTLWTSEASQENVAVEDFED